MLSTEKRTLPLENKLEQVLEQMFRSWEAGGADQNTVEQHLKKWEGM